MSWGCSLNESLILTGIDLKKSFHIFGIHIHFSLLLRGASVVFFERLPPSPQQLLNATKLNHVTKAALPPILLRNLQTYFEETNDDMTPLQQLKYIIYGGAPLPIDIGRWYHERGVNVCSVYGTTGQFRFFFFFLTFLRNHIYWILVFILRRNGRQRHQ